jgi:hypothetical protein
MGVAMHDKPAIPFRILAGLIKMMGFLGQAPHQRLMGFLDHLSHHHLRIAIMPESGQPEDRLEPQPLVPFRPEIAMTMATPAPLRPSTLRCSAGLLALLALTGASLSSPVKAAPLPYLDGSDLPRSCPALLPSYESFLEPMPLRPQDVPAKNAKGCLSPSDAIYGPDGCPKKLCPQPKGLGL